MTKAVVVEILAHGQEIVSLGLPVLVAKSEDERLPSCNPFVFTREVNSVVPCDSILKEMLN